MVCNSNNDGITKKSKMSFIIFMEMKWNELGRNDRQSCEFIRCFMHTMSTWHSEGKFMRRQDTKGYITWMINKALQHLLRTGSVHKRKKYCISFPDVGVWIAFHSFISYVFTFSGSAGGYLVMHSSLQDEAIIQPAILYYNSHTYTMLLP